MKNLPLGLNTLRVLEENNCVYVDKTAFILPLTQQPGRYFLSRPRRFGKSLLVDTFKELFEGNQHLFEGLFIDDRWDWGRTFPVISIDFTGGVLDSRAALDEKIREILATHLDRRGITSNKHSISGLFSDLIQGAAQQHGQRSVVLVDEYDKPILDNIENKAVAIAMREGLKNLYSVLKAEDAHLQFVFLTGVSKFSKVSLFSGLNQLTDLTIDPRYSSLCGYTDQDLRDSFGEHLTGVDWDELKRWYNGYSWTADETVYNPYDILLFIEKGHRFRNYWFETGSPNFLVNLFRQQPYFLPNLEALEVTEEVLESFEIERINPITLLFQTGYLTIKRTFVRRDRFMLALDVPNLEVRLALNDWFIDAYADTIHTKSDLQDQFYLLLETGDLPGLCGLIDRLFTSIPWRNFTNNNLAHFEGYYASVLYAFFAALDARIIPEDITNQGQADLTIMLGNHIYVMEFKVIPGETVTGNPALEQLQQRQYASKYRGQPGKAVHEVGLVFSEAKRGLLQADWC
ncbi:ATP-binding protein [Prochlorothrix hollandica]|uniref:ATP-binding protein n=1 Tax=Prochlorothrix hollandica TaxID=1223 RepID=UPI00333EBD53